MRHMRRAWLGAFVVVMTGCQWCGNINPSLLTLHDATPDDATPDGDGPLCAAPLTLCGGACVDLSSSPDHCDVCGRSCGGGACVYRKCQPVVLAEDDPGPNDCVTLVGDQVVYGQGGTYNPKTYGDIWSLAKDGTGPRTKVEGVVHCVGLQWNGSALVVMSPDDIHTMNKDGSGRRFLQNGGGHRGLTVQGDWIYWYASRNGVARMLGDGGAMQLFGPNPIPDASNNGSNAVVANDTFVYWGDDVYDIIVRAPLEGGAPVVVAQTDQVRDAVLDGDGGFFFTARDTSFFRMPDTDTDADTDAGLVPPETIATGMVNALMVLRAGQDIYVGDVAGFGSGLGAVWRYRTTTREWTRFVESVRYPMGFAADDDFFYFTVQANTGQTQHRQLLRVRR